MRIYYRVNFEIANNEDLSQAFAIADSLGAPIDLRGAILAMDVKYPTGSNVIQNSTANGRVILSDAINGIFSIMVPAGVIRALKPGIYVHDLLLERAGSITRVWSGTLSLAQGVTQRSATSSPCLS